MLDFVKLQGTGNDFIVVDGLDGQLDESRLAGAAERLCERHFGIGADGLILVLPSGIADCRMSIINADGSIAEMCGNGIRCVARYMADRGKVGSSMTVETLAGMKKIDVVEKDGRVQGFTVDMGVPVFRSAEIPVVGYGEEVVYQPLEVDEQEYLITCVSMGNPHCIIFTDAVDDVPLEILGPRIETSPAFPKKTNVEFMQVMGAGEARVRVWERGCGITLACGTGACASLAAAARNGRMGRRGTIHLPGGDLFIDWREDGRIYMTGPAEEVFTGSIALE